MSPYSRDWGETGQREGLAEGARRMMPEIAPADVIPGALALFCMMPRAIAKHVGILTGPDTFLHADERLGVIEEPLTHASRRRIAFAVLFPKLKDPHMAILVLGAAGAAIGGALLGVSAATIFDFIGSTIGSVVDSWIISLLAPTQWIEGAQTDNLRITSVSEGAVIPCLHGRMRISGNNIWATDFREETKTTT